MIPILLHLTTNLLSFSALCLLAILFAIMKTRWTASTMQSSFSTKTRRSTCKDAYTLHESESLTSFQLIISSNADTNRRTLWSTTASLEHSAHSSKDSSKLSYSKHKRKAKLSKQQTNQINDKIFLPPFYFYTLCSWIVCCANFEK